jgi:cytochrome P450
MEASGAYRDAMTEETPVRVTAYDEVAAAFTDPRLAVPEPDGAGPMDAFRRAVPRFTDGPRHTALRAATVAPLATVSPEALRARAYERATACLRADGPAARAAAFTSGGGQAPPLRTLPVAVLAEALGVPPDRCDAVAAEVAALAPAYLPGADDAAIATADAAVERLAALIGPARLPTAGCLLAQSCAASAALIEAVLRNILSVPPGDRPSAMSAVRGLLRDDPPLRATVRTVRAPVSLAGRDLAPGATVLLSLAHGAEAGEPYGLAFGSGPHRCPGTEIAVALACGVVEAVRDA